MEKIKVGDVVRILKDEFAADKFAAGAKLLTKGKLAKVVGFAKYYTERVRVIELESPLCDDGIYIDIKNVEKVEFPTFRGFDPFATAEPSFNIIGNIVEESLKNPYNNPFLFPLLTRKENFIKVNLEKDIKLVYINDKKNQVCIKWNDGTETKATCSENDDFDLNVGFAVAFTRKFFKSDRVLDKFLDKKLVKNKKKKEKE